jgi:hypothetical protein
MSKNINITPKNISGKCDLKCSYNFKYSESNSVAKNNGVMISLTYEDSNQVIYNNSKYIVDTISIFSPSIHIFNGAKKPGEIMITHNPTNGGNILEVCIPFTNSLDTSSASEIISDIITKVSSKAPSEGETTNVTINLQSIVPRKPFYAYSQDGKDYIVYGDLEALPLTSSILDKLSSIIKPYNISTPGTSLFFNSKGPTNGIQIGDGLYISCQPTGSSEEMTSVEYDKNDSSNVDLQSMFKSPFFKLFFLIFIGCIVFIAIFYGISKFYNYISNNDILTNKMK